MWGDVIDGWVVRNHEVEEWNKTQKQRVRGSRVFTHTPTNTHPPTYTHTHPHNPPFLPCQAVVEGPQGRVCSGRTVSVPVFVCIRACVCLRVCMRVYACACARVCVRVCAWVCVRKCVHARPRVRGCMLVRACRLEPPYVRYILAHPHPHTPHACAHRVVRRPMVTQW